MLAAMLVERGLKVEKQKLIEFDFHGIHFAEGLKADLLIENSQIIELKSVEKKPVHGKQLLTDLRLMDLRLGLLMNFGAATFKEGVKRVVNNY